MPTATDDKPEPWHQLKMCDFCPSDAIAVAPMVEDSTKVKWRLVCEDHLLGWWDHDMPPEQRLPVFMLPTVPERFPKYPIYEPRRVSRSRLKRFY
jgi:hypothetical protein